MPRGILIPKAIGYSPLETRASVKTSASSRPANIPGWLCWSVQKPKSRPRCITACRHCSSTEPGRANPAQQCRTGPASPERWGAAQLPPKERQSLTRQHPHFLSLRAQPVGSPMPSQYRPPADGSLGQRKSTGLWGKTADLPQLPWATDKAKAVQ